MGVARLQADELGHCIEPAAKNRDCAIAMTVRSNTVTAAAEF